MIEMIGVLAVIAILAAMLIPRVFQAVDTARVTSTMVACETVKTAAIDHYGRQGRLDVMFGTNIAMPANGIFTGYDIAVLLPEGLLEKPFTVRLAGAPPGGGDPTTNCVVELVRAPQAGGTFGGYMLDGVTMATTNAQYVLEAVIHNCSIADAKELNDRVDGVGLGAGDLSSQDNKGKIEYAAPVGGTTDVYVYLTHR